MSFGRVLAVNFVQVLAKEQKSLGESRCKNSVLVSLGESRCSEFEGVRCDGFLGLFLFQLEQFWDDGCSLARGLVLTCVVWIGFHQRSLHFGCLRVC